MMKSAPFKIFYKISYCKKYACSGVLTLPCGTVPVPVPYALKASRFITVSVVVKLKYCITLRKEVCADESIN